MIYPCALDGIGDWSSGGLARARTDRALPSQLFGLAFVRDACLNERVMSWLGQFHFVPLPLLTDRGHSGRLSMDRHSINDPRSDFLVASQKYSSPPKANWGWRLNLLRAGLPLFKSTTRTRLLHAEHFIIAEVKTFRKQRPLCRAERTANIVA